MQKRIRQNRGHFRAAPCAKTGISGSTFAKMTRGEDVTVNILTRICETMQCGIGDIMEIFPVNDVQGHNV